MTDLEKDAAIYMRHDRDTKGINGSPDITATIFDKIDRSILGIVKPMANLVYGAITLSEVLERVSHLLKFSPKKSKKYY